MVWTIDFWKDKEVDNDSYLEDFMDQASFKISGLELTDTSVDTFESSLPLWTGYNNWYTSKGKFASRGAYMDIDELCKIHNESNHGMSAADPNTRDIVYEMIKNNTESEEGIPLIPFVLHPDEYVYLKEGVEKRCVYKLTKEGRSRLAGVKKARDEGYFTGKVPVLFAIRRTRK